MNKFLAFVLSIALTISSIGGQDSPVNENEIVVAVKTAVNEDKTSNADLGKLYSLYKGTYYYAQDFEFGDDIDFGQVFDKQRAIKDKLKIPKGEKFGAYINKLMLKYETSTFDDNSKNKFAEEMNYISIGIKLGID